MLQNVNKYFDDIVVVLNTASVMDMEWLNNNTYKNIDAYMYSWLGGVQSGACVADVLTGEVTPSGKLPVTIMDKLENEETYENFGEKGDRVGYYYNQHNVYEEDIYLGYRYSETFGDEHVMHPFGYGLSYTDFSVTTDSITVEDKEGVKDDVIQVNVTVKNTGSKYSGKEVVQVYYGAPQGVLGKPVKNLVAYAKTHELLPGETQKMVLSFKAEMMASYDETGKTKNDYKSSYVLEAGNYPIYVGNSVKAEQPECYDGYKVESLTLVEKLQTVQPPEETFDRVVAKTENNKLVAKKEQAPKTERDVDARIVGNIPDEIEITGDKGIKLIDVYNGKKTIEEFVAQLSKEEVARLCRGVGGMGDGAGIAGNASAWGADWSKYGVPAASTCDGPSGIRWSGMATAIPTAISLGSTWNDELIERLCEELGKECIATTGNGNRGVDVLLAPGMNIIRDPRGGRNYEYFSEDPLLTGRLASAYVSGLQKVGVIANVKHYAGYQQGEARDCTVDSRMSERCLREIYLKPFEIAIKESNPYTLMDSNGDINGEEVYGSYDLNTVVLRNEWKWDGMVMTDWGPPSSKYEGSRGKLENMAHWVQSGCDCTMPGHNQGNYLIDSINKKNGGITLAEAQRNAINVLNCLMKTMKFARDNKLDFYKYEEPEYEAFEVGTQELYKPTLNSISIDGAKISNFESKIYNYTIFVRDTEKLPKVTYETPENTTVEARTEGTTVYLNVSSQGAVSVYKILFTNQAGMTPTVDNPTYAYLNNIAINGKNIPNFYPSDKTYSVVYDGEFEDIKITCDTPEGVTAEVTKDSANHAFMIRSESEHQAMEYVVYIISNPPQSESFEEETIGDFWTIKNKNDNLSKQADHLAIKTETGYFGVKEEDAEPAQNIVSQSAGGDWVNETQVKFDQLPYDKHHAVGIILSDNLDEQNFIWFRIEYTSQGIDIRVNRKINGVDTEVVRDNNFAKNNDLNQKKQLYFQVTKTGNEYTFAVRKDSTSAYTAMGSTTADFANPTFSLAALNNVSTKPITAQFHQVDFTTGGSGVEQETDPFVIKPENTNHCNRMYLADKAYYLHNLKIENSSGEEAGNKNLTGVQSGSYALYNVNVEQSGYYKISARQASEVASTAWDQLGFGIQVDGFPGTSWEELGGTDGGQKWRTLEGSSVYLSKGSHRIKLYFVTNDMNLCWLEFNVEKLDEKDPTGTEQDAEELAKAKTELQSAVDKAGTYQEDTYTIESWVAYKTAVTAAKAVLENKEATLADVKSASADLTNAEKALVKQTEPEDEELRKAKENLLTTIEKVKSSYEKGESKYTKESWSPFAEAYERANSAETLTSSSVEELEALAELLVKTQSELTESPVEEQDTALEASKAELSITVAAAKEVYEKQQNDYTENSWKEFKDAYEAAAAALEAKEIQTEEVTRLKNVLTEAQNKLVLKDKNPPINKDDPGTDPKEEELRKQAKTALASEVEKSKVTYEAGQGNYTKESWQTFVEAYEAAKTVSDEAAAKDLDELREKLIEAVSGLTKKPEETNTGTVIPSGGIQLPQFDQNGSTSVVLTAEETEIANLLGVATETAKKIYELSKSEGVSMDTLSLTEAKVTAMKGENDVKGSTFAKIQVKAPKQAKNTVKLSWNKVDGADGYIVYGNKCGKSSAYQTIKELSGANKTTYTDKKLKKATMYKYLVCAYKNVNGTKVTIAASKTVHAATKGSKYAAVKSVKVNKSQMKLTAGESEKIVAKEILSKRSGKKHRNVSYESSDATIATVSKNGKIKAKRKGNCTIYVYAQNGVYAKVTVKVR